MIMLSKAYFYTRSRIDMEPLEGYILYPDSNNGEGYFTPDRNNIEAGWTVGGMEGRVHQDAVWFKEKQPRDVVNAAFAAYYKELYWKAKSAMQEAENWVEIFGGTIKKGV